MLAIEDVGLPAEAVSLLTRGTVAENAKACVQLMQRFVGELNALQPGQQGAMVRAAFIGAEAQEAFRLVWAEVQKETALQGGPPLSEPEFRKLRDSVARVSPAIMKALVRVSPNVFGPASNMFADAVDKTTGLDLATLCAAYIRTAHQARSLYESDPESSPNPGKFMIENAIRAELLIQEIGTGIKPDVPGGPTSLPLQKINYTLEYSRGVLGGLIRVMGEMGLRYVGGGMQVRVLAGEDPVSVMMRLPVAGGSAAKANAALSKLLAKLDSPMPQDLYIGFRSAA